jgi:hypothetical protein
MCFPAFQRLVLAPAVGVPRGVESRWAFGRIAWLAVVGERLMRLVLRWGVAVVVSAAGFALAWWVCGKLIGLDEGVSLAIAGAILAVLLAVAAWWVPLGADGGGSGGSGRRLVQKARAGRDVNMAGRDQSVINYRRRDE